MLQIHVILSLVGILSGLVVLYRLLFGGDSGAWTALFLITTILTSLSGFPLPPFGFDPPRAVGVLSLVLLLGAVVAYYAFHLEGVWRLIYVGCAVAALYLNVFVLVAQGFLKVPFLHDLAPTGSEPPFAVTQGIVLLIFIALGVLAAMRFRPLTEAVRSAPAQLTLGAERRGRVWGSRSGRTKLHANSESSAKLSAGKKATESSPEPNQ
jgi:hypothetical protein